MSKAPVVDVTVPQVIDHLRRDLSETAEELSKLTKRQHLLVKTLRYFEDLNEQEDHWPFTKKRSAK